MANNKISVALESATAWAPTPAIYQEYKDYAAKFDRLVEAAKSALSLPSLASQEHAMLIAKKFDESKQYSVRRKEVEDELTAALRDIELESEAQ